MPLSIVTMLVRNLITVPAAVLRNRAAKDAEALALRHENAMPHRQITRNLVMDLEDAGCHARFVIRDRDGEFPACSMPSSPTQRSGWCSAASGSRG
jgi:hypothetical protein